MTIGVHDFEIPHEHVQPTRDMVIIRIPLPPKFMGDKVKFEIPNVVRDLAQHNVQAGRIVNMGPIAFQYKTDDGVAVQDANIGDWVIIRPFAGTLLQGGKIAVNSGWRYVSSFADILAVIPADKMPDPSTLLWTEEEADAQANSRALVPDFNFNAKRA
jgi:hypothetical protein